MLGHKQKLLGHVPGCAGAWLRHWSYNHVLYSRWSNFVTAAAWYGLVCKPNGRARTIVSFSEEAEKVTRCFTNVFFRRDFLSPAYCNSLGYRKLSQRLHVLLLWWSGIVVTALRLEVCGPRINRRLYTWSFAPRRAAIFFFFGPTCHVS